MAPSATIDEAKLEEFVGQVMVDAGAALSTVLAYAGDRLGLYRAMTGGPVTSTELAERTGTHERMVREWLANQAAGGYVSFDPVADTFMLPPEHELALTRDDTPAAVGGVFEFVVAAYRSLDRLLDAFRTGRGLGWADHHPELYEAVERMFGPDYEARLVAEWIPALDGVEAKLRNGARVADIGCGRGASTLIMARAFPRSTFVGFDSHDSSIDQARLLARDVEDRVRFEIADSTGFPGDSFDLICYFDALHDMGDPVAAAKRAREALADDGVVLLVEPNGADRLEENLTPLGRIWYAASTVFCTPCALDQNGVALGAQAGEARLRAIFEEAGFAAFRRAAETHVNLVFEARAK